MKIKEKIDKIVKDMNEKEAKEAAAIHEELSAIPIGEPIPMFKKHETCYYYAHLASVAKVNDDGTYDIVYSVSNGNGGLGKSMRGVPEYKLSKREPKFSEGESCYYANTIGWIAKVNGDGTYEVKTKNGLHENIPEYQLKKIKKLPKPKI